MRPEDQLSPHFTLGEFLHDESIEGVTLDVIENLRLLSKELEGVRKLLGDKPIKILSGFRTPEHNRAVGGVKGSQHLYGKAADIVVDGIPPHKVQKALADWPGGMGAYSNFTHLDVRGFRARWSGH